MRRRVYTQARPLRRRWPNRYPRRAWRRVIVRSEPLRVLESLLLEGARGFAILVATIALCTWLLSVTPVGAQR